MALRTDIATGDPDLAGILNTSAIEVNDIRVDLTAAQTTTGTKVTNSSGVPAIRSYTAAQGVPTAAALAAAGVPDGTLIVVQDS